jgi:hypothetical protein
MNQDLRTWAVDVAERAGAAAGLGAVSVVSVELADKPVWWALCLLPVLEVIRGWLARRNGEPATASFRKSGSAG